MDRDARALERYSRPLRVLDRREDDAAAGRSLASERPAELHGLAGDARRVVTVALAELVHHPRHRLRVRVHVRRGDVAVDAEDVRDHPREAALLRLAHQVRLTLDATLRAAERKVGDRRLPRHQRGERAHLVDVGLRVVTDAALVRAARAVVLHAVAVEHHEPAVVHANGNLNRQLAVTAAQHVPHLVVEADAVGCSIEEVRDGLMRCKRVRQLNRHRQPP